MGKPSQMERISRKEYELVREAQTESPDNEIRVKAYRRRFPYVAYIVKLLNEGKFESVNMIASGQAIQKLLDTVKLLRNRVSGVHCSLAVEVSKRVLRFEPREDFKETKEPIEKTRMRMSMKAVISSKALEEITSSSGYLPPMDDSELLKPEEFQNIVKEYNEKEKKPRGEGEGESRRGRGRGRGRGRRRGGRGRGRGRGRDRDRQNGGGRSRRRYRRDEDYDRDDSRDEYERRRRRDRRRERDRRDDEFDHGYKRRGGEGRRGRGRGRGRRRSDYDEER